MLGAATTPRLMTASFGRGPQLEVKLRTAFKSELQNPSYGRVDVLLQKVKDKTVVIGYKNLPRPMGMPAFEQDLFRIKAAVWQIPQTKLPNGIVSLKVEPGVWLFAPEQDMEFGEYKALLQKCGEWKKVLPENRRIEPVFGERGFKRVERLGLSLRHLNLLTAQEKFIEDSIRTIAITKNEEEVVHLDNDIARTRASLNLLREDPNKYDAFIKSGILVKAPSNKASVLLPSSSFVFENNISREISRCTTMSKEKSTPKTDVGRFIARAEDLKLFLQESKEASQ